MTGAANRALRGPGPRTSTRAVHAMAGLGATGASRFLVAVLIGRIGGPHLLGLTQTVISSAQLSSLIGPTSVGAAASRYVAASRGIGDHDGSRSLSLYFRKIALVLCGAIALAAGVGGACFTSAGPAFAICLALMSFAIGTYSVSKGVLSGAAQTSLSMRLELLIAAVSIGGVGCLLFSGLRTVWVILPVAMGYLVYTAVGFVGIGRGQRSGRNGESIRSFVGYGLLGTLASAGFAQAGVLVSAATSGPHGAGQYAAALALAAPASLLASSVSLALFPVLSEFTARGETAAASRHTAHGTAVMIFIVFAILGPAAILAPLVIRSAWGSEYLAAGEIAHVLLAAAAINAVSAPAVNALTSRSVAGMKISAAGSVTGALFGAAYWLIRGPAEMLDVAHGVLLGTAVFSCLPVLIVWNRDRPVWAGAWAKALIALLAMVALGPFAVRWTTVEVIVGAVLLLGVWILLNARILRSVIRTLARADSL